MFQDDTRNLCWNDQDSGIRIMNFNIILVILHILYIPFCIFSNLTAGITENRFRNREIKLKF